MEYLFAKKTKSPTSLKLIRSNPETRPFGLRHSGFGHTDTLISLREVPEDFVISLKGTPFVLYFFYHGKRDAYWNKFCLVFRVKRVVTLE